MPTRRDQIRALEYVRHHVPGQRRGDYLGRAKARWTLRVSMDDAGCWIWTGSTGGGSGGPAFTWWMGGKYAKRSAFWFMLEHWFPSEYAKWPREQRRSRARCGKKMCVSPLCHTVLTTIDYMWPVKLTEAAVSEILHEPASLTDNEVAERYVVSAKMVHLIRTGQAWRHVAGPRRTLRRHRYHARLTESDVWDILAARGHKRVRELADAYRVSGTAIRLIWNGDRHRAVYAAFHAAQRQLTSGELVQHGGSHA